CAAALPKRSLPACSATIRRTTPTARAPNSPGTPATAPHSSGATTVSEEFCATASTDARARETPSSSWEQRESQAFRVWRVAATSPVSSWRANAVPSAARRAPPSTAHVLAAVPAAATNGRPRPSRSTASPASTAAPVTTPTCTAPATGWSIRIRRSLARATRASEASARPRIESPTIESANTPSSSPTARAALTRHTPMTFACRESIASARPRFVASTRERPGTQHHVRDGRGPREQQVGITFGESGPHPLTRHPPRVLDLPLGGSESGAPVRTRGEPQHDRTRERPRLAAEIPDVADLDTDLLADLAFHATLQRLPGLDEPREHRVPAGGPHRLPRQQHVLPVDPDVVVHQADHRRVGAGVLLASALFADRRPAELPQPGRTAAVGAMARPAMPVAQRHGGGEQSRGRVVERGTVLPQSHPGLPVIDGDLHRQAPATVDPHGTGVGSRGV